MSHWIKCGKNKHHFYSLKIPGSVPKAMLNDLSIFYGFDDSVWHSEPTWISEHHGKTVLDKKIWSVLRQTALWEHIWNWPFHYNNKPTVIKSKFSTLCEDKEMTVKGLFPSTKIQFESVQNPFYISLSSIKTVLCSHWLLLNTDKVFWRPSSADSFVYFSKLHQVLYVKPVNHTQL